jgi:hypothetical protein
MNMEELSIITYLQFVMVRIFCMKHFLLMLIYLTGIVTAQGQTITQGKTIIEVGKDKETKKILIKVQVLGAFPNRLIPRRFWQGEGELLSHRGALEERILCSRIYQDLCTILS